MTQRNDAPPSGGRKDETNRDRKHGSDAATPGQTPRGRDQKRPGSKSNPGKTG